MDGEQRSLPGEGVGRPSLDDWHPVYSVTKTALIKEARGSNVVFSGAPELERKPGIRLHPAEKIL